MQSKNRGELECYIHRHFQGLYFCASARQLDPAKLGNDNCRKSKHLLSSNHGRQSWNTPVFCFFFQATFVELRYHCFGGAVHCHETQRRLTPPSPRFRLHFPACFRAMSKACPCATKRQGPSQRPTPCGSPSSDLSLGCGK